MIVKLLLDIFPPHTYWSELCMWPIMLSNHNSEQAVEGSLIISIFDGLMRPGTPFWTLVLALREGGLLVGTNLSRGRGSKEEFEKVFFGWNIVEIISILDTFAFPLRIYSNGISCLEALNLWKLLFSKSATWREGENVAWLCWTGWLTQKM